MVTQKEIFFQYLLAERDRLEAALCENRQNVRYRNIDIVDCFEMIVAIERYNSFVDFFNHSIAIFDLHIPVDSTIKIDISDYIKQAEEIKKFLKRQKIERG